MINLIRGWFAFAIAPLCFGGGGGSTSSSSASTTNTTTNNTDNRQVVSDNGMGFSNVHGSTINISQTDGGAVKGAVDMFALATAANTKDYGQLLNTSGDALKGMFTLVDNAASKSFSAAQVAQENARAMLDTAQSKGTLDNKTIAMLGVAALAAVGLFAFRKA